MSYCPDEVGLGQFQADIIRAKLINKRDCIDEKLIFANGKEFNMTPQEQLFVRFYNEEKLAVKEMDGIQLRAHRELLSEIALEARAKLTAVDDEERSRKGTKTIGFERSVNVDDITSNAINQIEKRNERLSKKEKIAKTLRDIGVDEAEIQKILSARGLRDVQAKSNLDTSSPASPSRKESNSKKTEDAPGRYQSGGFDWDAITKQALEMGKKPAGEFVNPFEPQPVKVEGPAITEQRIEDESAKPSDSIAVVHEHIEHDNVHTGDSEIKAEEVKPSFLDGLFG